MATSSWIYLAFLVVWAYAIASRQSQGHNDQWRQYYN